MDVYLFLHEIRVICKEIEEIEHQKRRLLLNRSCRESTFKEYDIALTEKAKRMCSIITEFNNSVGVEQI